MAEDEAPSSERNGVPSATNGRHDDEGSRPPRLPRWTRQEILVLIQGKKVAEGRVRRRRADGTAQMEPKWASVAAYCRRHGVNRGPVQCRKRWSNLAGDFKKIKEWESQKKTGESESFWVMRSDLRRERRLPGFFDKEVYDILEGAEAKKSEGETVVGGIEDEEEEEAEVIFDSGRAAAAEEGLFSDCEQSGQEDGMGSPDEAAMADIPVGVAAPTPISEKLSLGYLDAGMTNERQPTVDLEKGTSEGQKRRRVSLDGGDMIDLQNQLIQVLDQNSRTLIAQIEAQNTNCQLDRDQRKDHTNSLVGVLGKLADALDRIADKL